MATVLLVGIGGFVGSVLRYLLGNWVHAQTATGLLPYGTMAVNVIGCLAIGLVNGVAESRAVLSPEARGLLVAGLLGGFTTFSAFGYETFAMARDGQVAGAALNIGLQLLFGLAAVWAGYRVSQAFT